MPGGIDEDVTFAINAKGERVSAKLIRIALKDPELGVEIEERDVNGLHYPVNSETGIPDISLLTAIGLFFRGMKVIIDHQAEGNVSHPSSPEIDHHIK